MRGNWAGVTGAGTRHPPQFGENEQNECTGGPSLWSGVGIAANPFNYPLARVFLICKKTLYKLERICFNSLMEDEQISNLPNQCPVCAGEVAVTRLECTSCGTEINGAFRLGHLATIREPHASLLDMFLRVRGNVKDMERELGLSYPTVRARLEEALEAAGYPREARLGEHAEGDASWETRFEADLSERIRAQVEERLADLARNRGVGERHRAAHERERAAHELHRAGQERERAMRERERMGIEAELERALAAKRAEVLARLESGEITASDAVKLLRELKERR